MISVGANVNPNNHANTVFYQSPLEYAVETDNIALIDLLIDNGANIEAENVGGITALVSSAIDDRLQVAGHLVERGANISFVDSYGNNILHKVIWDIANWGQKHWKGDVPKTFKFMLMLDKTLLHQKNNDGYTPYMFACSTGNQVFIDYLKTQGAYLHTIVDGKSCDDLCNSDQALALHGGCSPFAGIRILTQL